MESVGIHSIVDCWDCTGLTQENLPLLDDDTELAWMLLEAAKTMQASVITFIAHRFKPQGISVILFLEQSHMGVHTWPELKYAAVDIFTCNADINHLSAIKLIREWLKPAHLATKEIERGKLS